MFDCQILSNWTAGPLKGNSGCLQSVILIVLCIHISEFCQLSLSVCPGSIYLPALTWPLPSIIWHLALQWPYNRSQCFLQSILLLEWFKVNWSSHSSCQNSFPSLRLNSKVWHQGPCTCFFPLSILFSQRATGLSHSHPLGFCSKILSSKKPAQTIP